MRNTAGELSERFETLRLPQCVLRLPQPLLIAQAVGDVVDELIGADLPALVVA